MRDFLTSSIKTIDLMEHLEIHTDWCYAGGNPYKYWEMVRQERPSSPMQVLIICNPLVYDKNPYQQEQWEAMVLKSFEWKNLKPENILYVYFNCSNFKVAGSRNYIILDGCSTRLKYKVDDQFMPTVNAIKELIGDVSYRDTLKECSANGYEHSPSRWGGFAAVGLLLAAIALVTRYFGFMPKNLGISAAVMESDFYRLFTYMFTHTGWSHLIGNCIALVSIGLSYAKKKGGIATVAVFILGGILAGIASVTYKYFTGSDVMTFGASGAIFALYGGLIAAQIRERSNMRYLIFSSATLLIYNCIGANIDWVAHIAGFVSGIIVSIVVSINLNAIALIRADKASEAIASKKIPVKTPCVPLQGLRNRHVGW